MRKTVRKIKKSGGLRSSRKSRKSYDVDFELHFLIEEKQEKEEEEEKQKEEEEEEKQKEEEEEEKQKEEEEEDNEIVQNRVDIRSFSSSAKTKIRNQVMKIVADRDLFDAVRIQNIPFKTEDEYLVVRCKLNTEKYSEDELEDYIHALNEKSIDQQPEIKSHGKNYKFTKITVKFRFVPLSREELKKAIDELPENSGIHPMHGEIVQWDVSLITDMHELFKGKKIFDEPLFRWNVSNVTNMEEMFHGCETFDQSLHGWNVSKVTNMKGMYYKCYEFKQSLNSWNVSNVTDMQEMFFHCSVFNQPLNRWNVKKVTNMSHMFNSCYEFNQPLNRWNVSNVTNMNGMFVECDDFNQSLDRWNVSNVTDMTFMFYYCSKFNDRLPWVLHPDVIRDYMFHGSDGELVDPEHFVDEDFEPDDDCEGEEDPISKDPIPKGRGFRLEAEAVDTNPDLKNGRCYDVESLINIQSQIGPMTRKNFTRKDKRRIAAYRRQTNDFDI